MIRGVTLVVLLAGGSLAPTAVAQEDGVFVDPDSPAGKEYAIPLDQARRDAAGGGAAGGGGGSGQSLFGAGIERAKGATKDGGNGSASARQSGPDAGGRSPQAERLPKGGRPHGRERRPDEERRPSGDRPSRGNGSQAADDAVAEGRRARTLESAAGGSETLLSAGVAAAVLGAGVVVAFGLRRLMRSP
jgi:hypothetical protein